MKPLHLQILTNPTMAILKTLYCLMFLMFYNMVIIVNSQHDESISVAPSIHAPFGSPLPVIPIASPSFSPSYAPSPRNIPYPTTPVSPSLPSVPSSNSPSYPATPSPSLSPSPSPGPTEPIDDSSAIKAAYWPSFNGLDPSDINTTYLTHIYYAFLLIDGVTYKLIVTPSDEKIIPQFIDTLRKKNPPVKSLLSIGGYNFNQTNYFSNMSTTKQTRAAFINSTIEIARSYGFDGVDLDWEFPSNDQEMYYFAILFREWRNALEVEARSSGKPRLLLTTAVYYSSSFTNHGAPRSYPAQSLNSSVDWINPMCYDYHGSWENFTGPNAALFDPNSSLSTSYGIASWTYSGLSSKKIVMGFPLYGRTWKLHDPNVNGIGACAVGAGPGDGVLSYDEILEFNSGSDKGKIHFDDPTVSYYSVSGDSWVGYDDIMSVDRKMRYARYLNLGGYFFWALGMDNNGILIRQASNSWDAE